MRSFAALLLSLALAGRALGAIDYDSGDDLRWGAPVTAVPLTLHAHYLTDTVAAGNRAICGLQENAASANSFMLDNAAATTRGYTAQASTYRIVVCAGSIAASTWYNGTFVTDTTTNRTVYRNGGNSQNNTLATTPSGINGFVIGFTATNQWLGMVGEVAVWNTGLSAGEIAALGAGLCPIYVHADNLVFYQSGRKSSTAEIGGAPTTTTGTPTVATHPTAVKYKHPIAIMP